MMSFSPRLAASALTVASLCLAGSAQAAPQAAKSTTVDVWEGTMPGVAPAEERAKQKEGTIETKDAHNAPDTVVFNVTHPTLEIVHAPRASPTARRSSSRQAVASASWPTPTRAQGSQPGLPRMGSRRSFSSTASTPCPMICRRGVWRPGAVVRGPVAVQRPLEREGRPARRLPACRRKCRPSDRSSRTPSPTASRR